MIHFDHLSFAYHQQPVIQDLSLQWQSGRITCLVGPNGSGKTTCLKLACGLLTPDSGRLLIRKQPVSAYPGRHLSRQIAYLPQQRPLPMISVRSLVSHGRFPYTGLSRKMTAKDETAIDRALAFVGLTNEAHRPLNTLSGGQQQKAYLALLLAQDSPCLLLDEPTNHLDIRHQLELFDLLFRLRDEGKTILLVMHDLSQAIALCDEIHLLSQGRLAFCGTPEALILSGCIEEVFRVKPLPQKGMSFQTLA